MFKYKLSLEKYIFFKMDFEMYIYYVRQSLNYFKELCQCFKNYIRRYIYIFYVYFLLKKNKQFGIRVVFKRAVFRFYK